MNTLKTSKLSLSQIIKITNHMNKYRANHKAQPIKYSKSVSDIAQKHAEYLASKNEFKHSDTKLGENLGMFYNVNLVEGINDTVDTWYSEAKGYNYENDFFVSGTGHFTQLCWNSTTEYGIGIATNSTGYTILVMNFSPPGNYRGKFKKNVFRY